MLGVGCWVLGAGCWVLGIGCWVLGIGCSVLGFCCGRLELVLKLRGVGKCCVLVLGVEYLCWVFMNGK